VNDQARAEDRLTGNWSPGAILTGSILFLLLSVNFVTAASGTGNLYISYSGGPAVLDNTVSSRVVKTDERTATPAGRTASDSLSQWEWRSPLPQPNALTGVAYGNNVFVAVGPDNAVVTSHDGINWTKGSMVNGAGIMTVIYANNMFVGVGNGIWFSRDGIKWTKRWSKAGLTAVSFGNNTFVVVGGASVLTSSDGIIWTQRSSPVGLRSLAYGNGIFVATGYYAILTSPDGVVWTNQPVSAFEVGSVVFGKGVFVTTQSWDIYTSLDGALWTLASNHLQWTEGIGTVLFCNGLFMASCGRIMISTDGLTWSESGELSGLRDFPLAVAYGNNLFVAVGQEGSQLNRPWRHCIYSSPDGLTWTERSTSVQAVAMTYGNGTFVGIAGTDVITSSDGIEWTERAGAVSSGWTNSIAFGNGAFAAVGRSGKIFTSPDGVKWTARSSGTSKNLEAITYGGGTFVAVGDGGTIVTSANGETWTVTTVASPSSLWLYSVAYSGERFVAVGYKAVVTSPDGIIWTNHPVSSLVNFTAMTFGNGIFTAFAITGNSPYSVVLATSVDGLKWQGRQTVPWSYIRGMAYGSGTFVAVGRVGIGGDTPLILTSSDGVSWRRQTLPKPMSGGFNTVTFGKGTFLAAGGGIAQSGNVCTYSISPGTKEVPADGGSFPVTITASDADCPAPAVSSSAGWITYADPVFTGKDATLQVTVAANPTSIGRKGRLSIAEASLSITQAGQTCRLGSLAPPSATYDKIGGAGQFAFGVTPADCLWSARQIGAAWIKITTGASGSGDGTISYTVKPNTSKKDRSANIKVTLKKGGASLAGAVHQVGQ